MFFNETDVLIIEDAYKPELQKEWMYVGVSFSTVYWPRDTNANEEDDDIYRMSKVSALLVTKG